MEVKSLLKQDKTEKILEIICDSLCKYPNMANTQDELDDYCDNCPLNCITKIEVKE